MFKSFASKELLMLNSQELICAGILLIIRYMLHIGQLLNLIFSIKMLFQH